MEKPRIIIADTDVNYIIPLQLKFVEEFFEKVDIEIITSEEYFNELFAMPQSVDILIVSESLYNQSVQRHNINRMFLMTEQQGEDRTTDLSINYIFKYTSIKEIFNEIISKSAEALNIKESNKQETKVIVFYSASGGTGKTTMALGVCGALTKNYKRVLYINAAYLQSFSYMMENSSAITDSEVYARLTMPNENLYNDIKHVIRREKFNYFPPFKATLMSLGIRYSIYEKIISSAKKSGDYDFIIVDTDSAFDEEKAELLNIADKVMVITRQNMSSVMATNILIANINGINGNKYIFICNDFCKETENVLISPETALKYTISEYVEHFANYEQMRASDIAEKSSIQRMTFLII